MTADDLKAQGNKAFTSGDFPAAISLFSDAIELAPSNHVLYSNRSAAQAALKNYDAALTDAEKCIECKPDWAKGYSRKGAALHGLGNLEDAVAVYQEGLTHDPENAALKKELESVEGQLASSSSGMNPFIQIAKSLQSPDVWTKIASNPKLAPLLSDPSFLAKIKEIQADPSKLNVHLQDKNIMTLVFTLMGMDMRTGDDFMDTTQNPSDEIPTNATRQEEPMAEQEPEPEVDSEEMIAKRKREQSDQAKELGNQAYKKKNFEESLKMYDEAWNLDETNVAILSNKAAVLFEMGKYQECIHECEKAVEVGRELRADFKLIARAMGRMGNAFLKLEDLDNAIKYYNKSLTEHRTAEILSKLREIEALKAKREKEAYISPELSEAARERGNNLFRTSDFVGAVREYTEAIKRDETNAKNYSNRAAAYMKLVAIPEAEKDVEKALELDPGFVKAYIRKAAILLAKRDYMKSIEVCQQAMELDSEGKHTAEIQQQMNRAQYALSQLHSGQGPSEESLKQAMANPEVQAIINDPIMMQILEQMKTEPGAVKDHLKNPAVAGKIRTLMNAGILRMGGGPMPL